VFDDKDARLKEKYLIKMLHNHHLNLQDALNRWRNNAEIKAMSDALNGEKKK